MGNARRPAADSPPASDREVGFAKLQGECFEYYMQTYSIVLGRRSRRSNKGPDAAPLDADDSVDVDLGALGGGMNVSRRHARIFYDFPRRRFALEVLGKNGCLVEGVHRVPGSAPVKLDSQDLLQRAILPPSSDDDEDEQVEAVAAAKRRRHGGSGSKSYREADDKLLLQLEEKDVISSAATVLSDLCGPQEWISMDKLHEVMFNKYGNMWHHSRVRKYLTSEDFPETETDGRPWHGLVLLLRKYPEHFVINIRKGGSLSAEFVSLVSLQS